jgi:cyclic pyranopterin phosphate synthase
VKINAVALKGVNDTDIVPLARFGREKNIEIRYIEFMPLDAQGLWQRDKVLLADDMLAMLSEGIAPLIPDPNRDLRAPATEYYFADGVGRVGFIASVSKPFCMNCNRIRLTADGKLRYCLFAIEEMDVRSGLRDGGTDDELRHIIRRNVESKWIGHEINNARFVAPPRPMYAIGG